MQLPLFGRMNNLQIPCNSWYKCFSKKEIKCDRRCFVWWTDYNKLNKCIAIHLNRTQSLSLWVSVLALVFYRYTVRGTMENEINFLSLKHLIYSFKSSGTTCVLSTILILVGRTEINLQKLICLWLKDVSSFFCCCYEYKIDIIRDWFYL